MMIDRKVRRTNSYCSFASLIHNIVSKKMNIPKKRKKGRCSVRMSHLSINFCMTRACFNLKTEIYYNFCLFLRFFRAYRNMKNMTGSR
jgi:hypothetical protein